MKTWQSLDNKSVTISNNICLKIAFLQIILEVYKIENNIKKGQKFQPEIKFYITQNRLRDLDTLLFLF